MLWIKEAYEKMLLYLWKQDNYKNMLLYITSWTHKSKVFTHVPKNAIKK